MKNLWSGITRNASKLGKVFTVKRALIAVGVIAGLAIVDYVAKELREADAEEVDELTGRNDVISLVTEEVNIESE